MSKERIVCTASHPVDLDDGRTVGPGEVAENVDVDHAHNEDLLANGLIQVQHPVRHRANTGDEGGNT